eukprot:2287698-Amphidinium_carterae.1
MNLRQEDQAKGFAHQVVDVCDYWSAPVVSQCLSLSLPSTMCVQGLIARAQSILAGVQHKDCGGHDLHMA